MGARTGEQFSQVDERPERIVELDPYYIDRTEVSRADYKTCLDAGACPALEAPCAEVVASGEDADRPVGCMNYARADAYCNWRNRRLPTEAEWEKAARGPFPRYVIWPWGDNVDFEVTVMACFFGPEYCLQPVDSYLDGASFYGVLHMAGNRAELVEDFYDADVYDGPNVVVSPLQSDNLGEGRVVRGGSFGQRLRYGRTANRAAETFGSIDPVDVGFRCALDAP
jgi:formylglycine-generating enzyme required for sulfatase activity